MSARRERIHERSAFSSSSRRRCSFSLLKVKVDITTCFWAVLCANIRCDSAKLITKNAPKRANTHTPTLWSLLGLRGLASWMLCLRFTRTQSESERDLPEEKSEKRSAPGNDLLSFFMGENVVNLFLLLRNACMMNILSRTTTVAAEEEKKRKGARRSLFSLFSPLFERTNGEERKVKITKVETRSWGWPSKRLSL